MKSIIIALAVTRDNITSVKAAIARAKAANTGMVLDGQHGHGTNDRHHQAATLQTMSIPTF